jgi:hypothetical protein
MLRRSLLVPFDQCKGFSLTAQSASGTGATYRGTYDPVTGLLDWNGCNYTKVIR